MSKWEIVALCVGAYALGGAVTVGVLVSRGVGGKATFNGFTGSESEPVKALEAFLAWPGALVFVATGRGA